MKWYRVTFARCGTPEVAVELSAHDAGDALVCAGVKSGLMKADDEYEDGEIEVVDLECIEPPDDEKLRRRQHMNALRGYHALSARIQVPTVDRDSKEDV